MNEQLQGKLVEILSGIVTATKAAGDFAMEQLPDIAQSYVMYGRAVATASFLSMLAFFCVSLFVALRYGYLNKSAVMKTGYYTVGSWTDERTAAAIGGTVASIASFAVLTGATLPSLLLVWFAPKVWLLKELSGMIK
jgi:hypothetical protein